MLPTKKTVRDRSLRFLICSVSALIFFAPLMALLAGKRGVPTENRVAYSAPSLNTGWRYFADLGLFAGDRIPLRPRALTIDAWIDQNMFDEDPAFGGNASPSVIHGSDGFLFLAEDFDNACAPTGTIDGAIQRMEEIGQMISESGRRVVFVIPPNKSTIHRQLVPKDLAKFGCWSQFTTELSESLSKTKTEGFLPVRQLIDDEVARTRNPLYLRKDSHWNSLGSLVAIKAVVKTLEPAAWDDGEIIPEGLGTYIGDLTVLEGLPSKDEAEFFGVLRPQVTQVSQVVLDQSLSLGLNLRFVNAGPKDSLVSGRSLLILDSFGEISLGRISPYFEDLTAIHFANWEPNLFAELIAQADNVWIMSVERYFTWRFTEFLGDPTFLALLENKLNAMGD